MEKINHAVICVAGLGSRLGMNMPKALVGITEGKKIIDFQLDLVEDMEIVSLVVGYKCESVVKYVKGKRDDLRIIHNPGFRNNSTSFSIDLAIKDVPGPYVTIDGDLLINKEEFLEFVNSFNGNTLIGITPTKTEDGVYVNLNENNEVISFQRFPKTDFEWANIACINKPVVLDKDSDFVYHQFEKYLPLESFVIKNLFEVDTPNDLKLALSNLDKF